MGTYVSIYAHMYLYILAPSYIYVLIQSGARDIESVRMKQLRKEGRALLDGQRVTVICASDAYMGDDVCHEDTALLVPLTHFTGIYIYIYHFTGIYIYILLLHFTGIYIYILLFFRRTCMKVCVFIYSYTFIYRVGSIM